MAEKVGEIFYEVSLETGQALNNGRSFRKDVKETEASLEGLNKKLSSVGRAVQGFLTGLAIASVMRKIIQETRNAEQEQAQLAAVLRSTGESADWSAEKLNAMADAMSKKSIFSPGEITQAQTRLLSYANIVGEKFPEAMQATIDMAARLNMSITQSGETIGRALDKPSEGMQTLRRQGFKFGEDQIALAKKLEATGRIAEAQALVLSELNFAYGGAAQASRDTFGGAITALQNQLNDLLTADGASLGSATKAVNELTDTLGSSQTKAAFTAITGWVIDLTQAVVDGAVKMQQFISKYLELKEMGAMGLIAKDAARAMLPWGDPRMTGDTDADIKRNTAKRAELIAKSAKLLADAGDNAYAKEQAAAINSPRQREIEELTEYIDLLKVKQKMDAAPKFADPRVLGDPGSISGQAAKMNPVKLPDATGAKAAEDAAKKAAREAEALRKHRIEEAKTYMKALDDQLVKTQDVTAYEKLMLDVKKGNVHLSEQQLRKAQGLATAIDMVKDLEEARAAALSLTNAQLSAQRDLMAQIDAYNESIEAMSMSDRSAQDMQNRSQIVETYLNRMRDLEDQQRNALASNSDKGKEAGIKKQYDDQIAVQQDYQARALAEYDRYVLARNAKEEDWSVGAQKAYGNYLESARNAAQQSQDLWAKAFTGMEDAVVNFAKTGKLNFKDLANTIIADLIRIQVRTSMVSALGGSGGWLSTIFGGGTTSIGGAALGTSFVKDVGLNASGLAGMSSGGYTGDGGKYEPKGIVHGGEYVINKAATGKLGLDFLDRLNGYSSGGYVGAVPAPSTGSGGGGGLAGGLVYAPVITIDGTADKAAALEQTRRAIAESQKQFVEQLKRMKVLPQ